MKNKTNLAFVGINGRMTKTIISSFLELNDSGKKFNIVGGIEKKTSNLIGKKLSVIPTFQSAPELSHANIQSSFYNFKKQIDVVIDFSTPQSTLQHLKSLKHQYLAYIIGTTGFTEKAIKEIKSYAQSKPIVLAGNFSIGINVLLHLLKQILHLPILSDFDIEVTETHHRYKVDAPSGTANMIIDNIKKIKKLNKNNFIYDRHRIRRPRGKDEIGISSQRGGGVIGNHEVNFYSDREALTIKHSAIDRSAFSYGVIQAVDFCTKKITNKENGFFGIDDVLFKDL